MGAREAAHAVGKVAGCSVCSGREPRRRPQGWCCYFGKGERGCVQDSGRAGQQAGANASFCRGVPHFMLAWAVCHSWEARVTE